MKTKSKKYLKGRLILLSGILILSVIISFYSCEKSLNDFDNTEKMVDECNIDDNMAFYSTVEDLQADISALKSGDKNRLAINQWTSREDFIRNELKTRLSEPVLKSANLDMASVEVEDSVIFDPYLLKIVNGYREVQINSDVYRLTRYGTFICTEESRFKLRALLEQKNFREMMAKKFKEHVKSSNEINTNEGNNLKNVSILPEGEYVDNQIYYVYPIDDEPYGGGSSGGTPSTTTTLFSSTTDLTRNISMNECDEGDKTLAGEVLENMLGFSVNCENNFSSNKRVKTVFWAQNWFFYASVGIKVKMQSKVLGVWWAKEAQELELGWEGITYEIKTSLLPQYTALTISPDVWDTNLRQVFSSFSSLISFLNNFGLNTSTAPTMLELHQAMCEKGYTQWYQQSLAEFNSSFWALDYYADNYKATTFKDKFINYGGKAAYNALKGWLKPDDKAKVDNLLAQKRSIIINVVNNSYTVTRMILPGEDMKHAYSENKMEYLFDYSKAAVPVELGVKTNGDSKVYLVKFHKAPNTYTILKGSSIYGAAKYNDTWKGSKIVKKE